MRPMLRLTLMILSTGILAFGARPALLAQDAEMLRHFDYDSKAPLEIKEIGVEHRGSTSPSMTSPTRVPKAALCRLTWSCRPERARSRR